jgi:uncharacterized protein YabE (DUF348 family)
VPHLSLTSSGRTRVAASALAASLGVLGIAGFGVVSSRAEVVLEVDGVSRPVVAWGGTVSTVLAQAGVEPGAHDLVSPAADEPVRDGATVVVRTAHPFDVTVDGVQRRIWSTSASADAVLADAGVDGGQVIMAADRSSQRPSLTPLVSRTRAITVDVAGRLSQVTVRPGEDARTALAASGVEVSPNDRVSLTQKDGDLAIQVVPVTRGVTTTELEVPYGSREEQDGGLFQGERVVATPGRTGTETTVQWTESRGGEVVHRSLLSRSVTAEPVDEVVRVGAQEATPQALVAAGLDPKATLEEAREADGTVSVRYRAKLGTLSTAAEIAAVTGAQTAASAAAGSTAAAPTASAAEAQAIAQGMVAARGWDDSEFQCLVTLWSHESGWSVTASNPSGAYGIPQALPGSKMASAGADWQTSAATQITWGLGYISGRYVTPCSALAHWQSTGWY